MRRVAAMVAAMVLTVVACSADTGRSPTAERTSGPATVRSSPQSASGSARSPSPTVTTRPLVLAINVRRAPVSIPEAVARRVVEGRVHDWAALGQPPGPLRVTDRTDGLRHLPMDTVAAVVADAVGPATRVVRVGGVDPLRDPDRYPIQVLGPEHGPVTTLTVVGDVMLGRRVRDRAAAAGNPSYALRPMTRRLATADVTVGNLESTLSRAGAPTQGGDSFAADPRVTAGLADAGFDVVGLANNHVGDFGDRALLETVRRLWTAGLATVGAGRDLHEALRPVVVQRHGVRFGFLAFNTIGETPEAGPHRPGALSVSMPPRTGPLDRRELGRVLRAVRRLERRADVVVVLPHWGTQYTARPEPVQHRVARALARAGADLVVGGHPHWVQGASLVGDTLVVHSLGNFVFDMDFMPQTQAGLMLEATFWGDRLMGAEFVPYRIGPDFAPRVVAHARAEATFDLFWQFSSLGAS